MADNAAVRNVEACDESHVYRLEVDVAEGRLVEARRCVHFRIAGGCSLALCRSLAPTRT